MRKLSTAALAALCASALACGDDGRETGSSDSGSESLGSETTDASTTTDGTSSTDATAGPGGSDSETMTGNTTSVDTTTPGVCGDGSIDEGEECDDGDNGPGQACLEGCVANVCGDGDKGPGEGCDDGPANNDSGVCKSDCTLNVCGDGHKGPAEGCDDGNNVDDDECTNSCSVKTCGNGVLDPDEECDDGNDIDEDACTNTCVFPPSPCGTQEMEATLEISPVDVIISIDNSGSMGNEIQGVQDNINVNFASIIEKSGLDYRVIMVTRHGNIGAESVCIEAPLSGIPEGGCNSPPSQPVANPPIFYHYSEEISSHNMWCKLLETYPQSNPDEFGQAGWSQWLRKESLKTFIAISDDGIDCGPYDDNDNVNDGLADAAQMDADLLALDPQQFGTVDDRRYSYYSIVGMAYNNPPDLPYAPMDPVITGQCPTAADPGTGHQGLSVHTNALRFPLCDTSSYDVVFQAIAQGVITGSSVACEFPVPTPPDEEEIDLSSVVVKYQMGGMGDPVIFDQVAGPDECGPNKFYILGDTIYLCPEACTLVQDDFDAALGVEFACLPDIG
ncbi:MAG: hypothetical protein R3A51_03090 [Nannocystaceae bacterium]|nr:hypothetical protein [Myxococcales bacterium]